MGNKMGIKMGTHKLDPGKMRIKMGITAGKMGLKWELQWELHREHTNWILEHRGKWD